MADPAQQSQPLPPTAPKTRLGLSLSERIKVIEARQMGKSMRQVSYFHPYPSFSRDNLLINLVTVKATKIECRLDFS